MKKIIRFAKANRWISAFFVLSATIIISYILSMDMPELFPGAENWYNLLFQFSIGYIINTMFYVTQVYIPSIKRQSVIRKNIHLRISKILSHMRSIFSVLAEIYLNNHTGNTYTNEELHQLLKFKLLDLTKDVDLIRSIHSKRTVYYTVGEYIEHDILNVERYIDDIYKYYSGDMSEGLIGTLEKILNSRFHFIMKAHFNVPFETDFSSSKLDFFVEYYTMLCDLNSVDIDDYTSD